MKKFLLVFALFLLLSACAKKEEPTEDYAGGNMQYDLFRGSSSSIVNKKVEKVGIWAYCLMSNHIHLLAVPETETSLSRGIGLANQMYTQYLNRKLKQSGRIWQNRFFSCVVENEQYLWAVAHYIERTPIKAGLATNAEGYRWSSAKAHVSGAHDPLLAADSWLSPQEYNMYREFVAFEDKETDSAIRKPTNSGRPFGSESFVDMLEFRLNQALKPKKPGRPKKKIGECPSFSYGD